ncbi:MAG: hypothetical protein FWD66_05800 [Paludibacter sp.]|nr:hypothetical protein [Paludibacter sp.]
MWIYKRNISRFLIVFLLMTACNKQQKKNTNEYSNDNTVVDSSMIITINTLDIDTNKHAANHNITLYELYSNPIKKDDLSHWGTIVSYFIIGNNKISIDWNANCEIIFKSTFLKDKIVLYWNIEYIDGAPCEGYFNLFKSIKSEKPAKNEKFAEMSLLNDTTILVKYEHKKWIHKINYNSDCLFPDTLRYYKSW